MAKRDIVVVGASAGGVAALMEFVKFLPADFKGSVFIVLHISSSSHSHLPEILSRSGPLPAVHPNDGDTIEPGKIYIASPDHHLLLDKGKVMVKKGPKENRSRPSIDALFRSAAYVYGPRVVGIILSGTLNDGTSGLWNIKRMGGTCIIQDPSEAQHPEMPVNALEYVKADYVIFVNAMGGLLAELVKKNASKKPRVSAKEKKLLELEVIVSTRDNAFELGIMEMGTFTPFTCPECYGALVQLKDKVMRFRCHTGHAYTASTLLAGISDSVEGTMWQSMRALEESIMLLENMAKHFTELGHGGAAKIFLQKSKINSEHGRIIHDSILTQQQLSEDLRFKKRAKN